jgi:hypothetical protein
MEQERDIPVKVNYLSDIRRVKVNESMSYVEFRKLLNDLFQGQLPANFLIKYTDDDNDMITITSDIELREAFTLCSYSILKVFLSAATPVLEERQQPMDLAALIQQLTSSPPFRTLVQQVVPNLLPQLFSTLAASIPNNINVNNNNNSNNNNIPFFPAEFLNSPLVQNMISQIFTSYVSAMPQQQTSQQQQPEQQQQQPEQQQQQPEQQQ